jgi:hypothetical protein
VTLPTDAAGRIRFYRELTARLDRGQDIDPKEEAWLETFKRSSQYQTLIEMEADYLAMQAENGQ